MLEVFRWLHPLELGPALFLEKPPSSVRAGSPQLRSPELGPPLHPPRSLCPLWLPPELALSRPPLRLPQQLLGQTLLLPPQGLLLPRSLPFSAQPLQQLLPRRSQKRFP